MNPFYSATDHFVLLPVILLGLFGSLALFFDRRAGLGVLIAGELFTIFMLGRHALQVQATGLPMTAFQGALTVDGLSLVFNLLFALLGLLCALISYRYLEIEQEHQNEYYGLLLFAQAGMYLLAAGTELVTLFIGLETMSVSFYVLVGFLRGDRRSNEAAMKYLLLGAFSTGFLGYGFSLLYGLTGSNRLSAIGQGLAGFSASDPLLLVALLTTAVGLLFKMGAAPFHMWTPDAYEGAPTPVSAFLSTASKAAAIVMAIRLLLGPLAELRPAWEPIFVAAALASLTIGNFAAVTQSNVKRLLAYSSISHIGYILLAILAGTAAGVQAALVYTVVYAFMNVGAFLVLIALRREQLPGEYLEDFSGLIHRSPLYGLLMLVFLLSLAGIPPTAGFLGKYYVFFALMESGRYGLALVGAVYVAVSLYYYFRVVRAIFAGTAKPEPPLATSWGVRLALAATAAVTVGLGLYPEPLLRWMKIAG